jgi:hypothetical protein
MPTHPAPIDVEEFRNLVLRRADKPVPVRRFVGDDATPEAGELLNVTMSTESADRASDTVDSAGWDTKDFDTNPVLVWCHDYSLPVIGNVVGTAVEARRLVGKRLVFTPEDVNPFGAMVGRLYTHAQRFQKGFSVGFLPEEWVFNEGRGGVDFKKQKLLELSACPIPMNQECLSGAKSAGISLKPLHELAVKTLDGAEARHWLSPTYAFAVHRTLGAPVHQVPDVSAILAAEKSKREEADQRIAALAAELSELKRLVSKPPPAPAKPVPVESIAAAVVRSLNAARSGGNNQE